jgi:hypothetical protein
MSMMGRSGVPASRDAPDACAGSAAFTRAIALDNHPIMSDNLLQD